MTAPTPLIRVFVYGTLLTGQSNHALLHGCTLVRAARTQACFELVDLGAFPGLVAGGTVAVAGEVYAVDETTLARLDRLEGHPHFYERKTIRLEDGEEVMAYLLPAEEVEGLPRIASGDWVGHHV